MLNLNESMVVSEPRETAKMILENTDAILTEMKAQLDSIEFAVIGMKPSEDNQKRAEECMLDTLRNQSEMAEGLLQTVIRIKARLW